MTSSGGPRNQDDAVAAHHEKVLLLSMKARPESIFLRASQGPVTS